ncbi:MAG: bifunctional UDP-N-acetylmuramoyl-tripeptide:D-alanyl-D-alanine ligase/alanine racemase [Saprospiraceae bacterium]|nr:bifunctional UDP-N-acetylmuramoyl-tripeptide:D-alanyl-D-alanine ligase/alanine racemase [Saprospiraceae bacterium]
MERVLDSGHISNGQWLPAAPERLVFSRVSTDSRTLFQPATTLFFCLRGPRHDGHLYQQEAWEKGVRHFVVDTIPENPQPDTAYLLVEDTLHALQQMAKGHREQFHYPVIGITGSNGKTTVKEWLYHVLKEEEGIIRSPRSFNSQIGVPLSLTMMGPEHQRALIEAGISRPGEMIKLEALIQPDMGILTSLGSAHDEGFSDLESKLQEKLILFKNSTTLIVPAAILKEYPASFSTLSARLVTWSTSGPADLQIFSRRDLEHRQEVTFRYHERDNKVIIPQSDDASFANAMTCLLTALTCGRDMKQICDRIQTLSGLSMRLESREGWNGNLIINDYYNADLEGVRIALSFLHQRRGNRSAWIILSDLDDTGLRTFELVQRIAVLLQDTPFQRLSCIGSQGPELIRELGNPLEATWYPDVRTFLENNDFQSVRDTAILIKGARRFALEEISRTLTRFVHRTRLEVNLTALSNNLKAYAEQLRPTTKIMVMVKASAYGSGSADIARLLDFQKVHYLGVAYADEGVELRQAGLQLPIIVMNPDESSFASIMQHRLEPEIHSIDQLRQFINFLSPADPVTPIHLKIETGMHRLGLTEYDLPVLIDLLSGLDQIYVSSCFSHLSASENKEHDAFTHQQTAHFLRFTDQLFKVLGYSPMRHILNSAGILRFPEYQFEMVRLGIGLYGLEPSPTGSYQSALTLKTHIARIHQVPAGDSVGYGRKGSSSTERTIATLGIGYADGLLRLAGEGRFSVQIHGQLAPTVGAICMDMCMVDISHIPHVYAGDEAILFDEHYPISHLAKSLQTIPYEVLTNISSRVNRIYYHE